MRVRMSVAEEKFSLIAVFYPLERGGGGCVHMLMKPSARLIGVGLHQSYSSCVAQILWKHSEIIILIFNVSKYHAILVNHSC